jgi:serine/threonine-protein kinase
MAPEVLRDEPTDTRADIFSLGVTFYEMLAGQHPFREAKPVVTLDRVLHHDPLPLREAVPAPKELERIVNKMLAKDPAARYATAADLAVDLRGLQAGRPPAPRRISTSGRIIAIIAILLIVPPLLSVVGRHWRDWIGRPALPETKNLAVLPFASSDPGTRAYSEGLAETLGAKLVQLTDRYPLQVIPISEVRAQKISSVDQARIGLGATLVLEGAVRQVGQTVRVTYDLVDARAKRTLRADTITLQAHDPFAIEDHVVDSVLRSLQLELSADDRHALARHGTTQPAAYDFYVQGRGYLQEYENPENLDSAITVFQHALERDPQYALAYAGLGEAYWQKYKVTHDVGWMNKAAEACARAVGSAAGHACLGRVLNATGQYEKAAAEFEQAVQMDPTSDDAYRNLATVYEHLGRVADAEKTYRQAIRLRPNYWAGYNWLGTFLFRRSRLDEAIAMFAQVTMLAPDSFRGYNNLGAAYLAMGRYADAVPALQRSVTIRPNSDAYSNLGTALFYRRRFGEAAGAFRQAIQLDAKNYLLWGNLADALYWGTKPASGAARGEAAEAYQTASALATARVNLNARDAAAYSYLGLYQAMLGKAREARAARDRSVVLSRSEPEVLFNAALISSQLGDSAEAVSWIAKTLAAGYSVDLVRNSPNLDKLRSSAAFQQVLQAKH